MSKYADYFDIDSGYYPVINPNSIADKNNRWDYTFPHKTFIDLLETVERMIGRQTSSDKYGVWVEGAYGTGKSRIVWTLKCLLDCSEEEFNSYFDKYDGLRAKTDLRNKLLACKRQGKIVAVSKYGSSEINSVQSLVVAVYESISKALEEYGLTYKGQGALRDRIADWIKQDEARREFFAKLIDRPKYKNKGSFAGKTIQDIISELYNHDKEASNLTLDILDMAREEGISAFSADMDALIAWIKDIIDGNNLTALLLIWDEFSDFFKNNRTRLSEFQRLAELAGEKPFYLVIVTHSALSSENDQSFKTVSDRFKHKSIQMPDNIAFQLINHAIMVKPAMKEQWSGIADDLNDRVKDSCKAVAKETKLDESVFKGLMPIHPMAALLLKHISTAFASNQRSMFNFIKNEDADLHAFQWYINNHGPEDDNEEEVILTIDYLWDFFYENGVDDLRGGVGRRNLDLSISMVLDTYPHNEARLSNDDEKRVLKIILMMQAISQRFAGSLDILHPTARNVELACEGIYNESKYPLTIANNLVKKGILYKKSGKDEEYAAASMSGDQAQIENIKTHIRENTTTFDLLQGIRAEELLSLAPSQKVRFSIDVVTKDMWSSTIKKKPNIKGYQIKALLLIARNQDEREFLRNNMTGHLDSKFVFIDATESMMDPEEYEVWLENYAESEYWKQKDGTLSREKEGRAEKSLTTWKNSISHGSFVLYGGENNDGVNCDNIKALQSELAGIVLTHYPLSFDHISVNENLYSSQKFVHCAKNGILQTAKGICQGPDMQRLLNGIWSYEGRYWEEAQYQKYEITKLKLKIDKFIDAELRKNVRVSIGDIYEQLAKEGFMPCNLYALLMGFLLKEYTKSEYRYSVGQGGDESGSMTSDKLAEFISEWFKNVNTPTKKYKVTYIEVMSQNQKAFVECSRKIFGFEEGLSVDQVVRQIRGKVSNWGYPLWCYKTIDRDNLGRYIDGLSEILNSESSISSKAESFFKDIADRPGQIEQITRLLQDLITADNGKAAFKEYLDTYEDGKIPKLAYEIGVADVYSDAQQRISGSGAWLWNQKTGEDELRKLITDYQIVLLSKEMLPLYDINSWDTCIKAWVDSINNIRIPERQISNKNPEKYSLVGLLAEISRSGSLSYEKRSKFLGELQKNQQWAIRLVNDSLSVFKEIYAEKLEAFNEETKKTIYNKLPLKSFLKSVNEYNKELDSVVTEAYIGQKSFDLRAKWKELTDCDGPRAWSATHKTPIMSLVPEAEKKDARLLFTTLENKSQNEVDITNSLKYLSERATFTGKLKDEQAIEQAFRDSLLGKHSRLLSNNEVRNALEHELEDIGPYDWFDNSQVQVVIKELLDAKYSYVYEKVFDYLDRMTGEEAKDYLKELISKNPAVGIEIFEGGMSFD